MVCDLRILLTQEHAEVFRTLKKREPRKSNSIIINQLITNIYREIYIKKHSFPNLKPKKINNKPVRIRILYTYQTYHYILRFTKDFQKSDAEIIRNMLSNYNILNGGK